MNDLNILKNCLSSCKEAMKGFETLNPNATEVMRIGLQKTCASMKDSRKRLVKIREQQKRDLERRNTNGRN